MSKLTNHVSPSVISTGRMFSSTPSQIFAAFANPQILAQWWGPSGFTNSFEQFDFRPGGIWRFVMHGPNGIDYPNQSIFQEICTDARIVIEHILPPWFKLTITLTSCGDQTYLAWDQQFENEEVAEKFRPIGAIANEQNLDRLQLILQPKTKGTTQ